MLVRLAGVTVWPLGGGGGGWGVEGENYFLPLLSEA